ncbi:hypothetical protein [Arthrobacter sp. zg-Y179]|uniref:hypothetical protein n=1 Tax=Arthrobacter sp. zg-Y179 TaxID=2894188 RepID=UPI001E590B0B|nr:hypothetical protein [Arthrobacter sp. zg-Y179]MCC9175195.1 hypothetical protein [Arthrobacter sp. zg-Y179]
MGFLDFLDGTKRAAKASAAAATEALVADLTAALPKDATVSARSWGVGTTTYTAAVTGSRRELPILVSRLNGAIHGLGRTDDLEVRIEESAAPDAPFSSLLIIGQHRDADVLAFLVRMHEELLAGFPRASVLVDGSYGGFTVSGVARDDAVPAARRLVTWWEDMLAAELERWPMSEVEMTIGGTAEEPEISYSVALDEPEDGAAPVSLEEKRQEARRAVAAWIQSLPDLEALAKTRVRPGYAVRFSFTPTKFKPRVVVEDLETGDEDEDETAEMVAATRYHHPASTVKA